MWHRCPFLCKFHTLFLHVLLTLAMFSLDSRLEVSSTKICAQLKAVMLTLPAAQVTEERTQSLLTQLELQSSDPPLQTHPTPTSTHRQRSGKLFGTACTLQEHVWLSHPRMPPPLQKPLIPPSLNLNISFWGKPKEHTQLCFSQNEHLHPPKLPCCTAFPLSIFGTHTYRYSLLNGTSPRRRDSLLCVSELSPSIPRR